MTRRPGRPPLDPVDPSVKVSFSLPAKRYDALYRAATVNRTSISEFIRQSLRNKESKLGKFAS
jgi:hypothetical protein